MKCRVSKIPLGVGIYQHIQNLKFLDRVTFCTSVILLILMGFVVFPNTSTKDAEATPTQSTTTLTLSTSTVSTSLFPNNATGTFIDSDPSTISVTTNNYTGYTLGITSSDNTNNTKLINTKDNTLYLSSISSASTANEFNANNWGYLPSKLNGANNTKYQPAPTTTSTTLDATNAANSATNTYTIKLGTKIDYTLPTGIYTNSYTVTAVANPVTYSITYNKNTTDTVSNMPSNQSGTIDEADVTIPNTTPTREHYTFQGWCTTTPTTSNGVDSCSGTTYQPGDVVNMNKTTTNTLSLRAIWKIDSFKQTTRVRYEVAGADGTYGSYTTVDTKTVNYGDSYSWSSSSISGFDTNTYNSASVASYTVTAAKTNSVNITRKAYAQTTRVRYEVANADGTYGSYTTVDTKSVKSGGTYSWSSSSISGFDTATYDSASVASYTVTAAKTNSINITRKSYKLTVSRDSNYITSVTGTDTYKVGKVVGITATAGANYKFTKWTQTAGTTSSFGSATSASTTFTMPASAATIKANGKIYYIQGVTTSLCPTTATTVYDSRDSTAYQIQKLADGKCWMLDNLALDLTNSTVKSKMTTSTTNATATALNYLKNGGGSGQYARSAVTVMDSTNYYNAPRIYKAQMNTIPTDSLSKAGKWKVGILYNYCAVSAGSYCYDGEAGVDVSGTLIDATSDICPKNWRLPTGGSSGELWALYSKYNNYTKFRNAFHLSLAGGYCDGSYNHANSTTDIMSSTFHTTSRMKSIEFNTSSISSSTYNEYTTRYVGWSARCVAK